MILNKIYIDFINQTPLMNAISKRNYEIIQLLLSKKEVNVNLKIVLKYF